MKTVLFSLVAVVGSYGVIHGQARPALIPVQVELITRAVSKTPVLVAYDKGLYEKYGLNVTLWLPPGEFPGAIETGPRLERPEFSVDGGVPMVTAILRNTGPRRLTIASTDCQVRFNIVGQKHIKTWQSSRASAWASPTMAR